MKRIVLFCLVMLLPCVSCAAGTGGREPSAAELRQLTAAVEVYVRYSMPAGMADEQDILRQATAHEPRLLEPFDDARLRVGVVDRHGVVLVCTKDGAYALMEDSGCAAPLERDYRNDGTHHPCEVSFTPADVCPKR